MLKAILFDVDGTLAETEELHRSAFNRAFAEHGRKDLWSVDQYRELLRITGGKERLVAYFREHGSDVSEREVAALHASKNASYANLLAGGRLQPRPGVQRLMHDARRIGIKLGIATTTSAVNLDALLRPMLGADWAGRFACVVAGDEVARKKPAPDVYLACLVRLGLRPGEVVAIEDSPPGIEAARAAGIAVLATPSSYSERGDFSGADWLLPDLGDPDCPWPVPVPGFRRPWVEIADLQRLLADRAIAQGNELAQQ